MTECTKRLLMVVTAVITVGAVTAWAGMADKHWGLGVQLNYPFSGLSLRLFSESGLGFELNLAPSPGKDALELVVSGRLLYPVRREGSVNYYLSGGVAGRFVFTQESDAISRTLDGLTVVGMAVVEVENILIDRLAGTFEYGLSWDVFNPLNFSFWNGGIGFHYYP